MTINPTHADDLERLIRILSDAPADGMALHTIQQRTETEGNRWSLMTINGLLCDLGNRVSHQKVRTSFGKITLYQLRRTAS